MQAVEEGELRLDKKAMEGYKRWREWQKRRNSWACIASLPAAAVAAIRIPGMLFSSTCPVKKTIYRKHSWADAAMIDLTEGKWS